MHECTISNPQTIKAKSFIRSYNETNRIVYSLEKDHVNRIINSVGYIINRKFSWFTFIRDMICEERLIILLNFSEIKLVETFRSTLHA